jgi:RNA-binding protein
MNITERQRKILRGLGHSLKPVIFVGQAGVSDAVLKELEQALAHHELLKVNIRGADRADRDSTISALVTNTGAQLIQSVGNMALLYRRHPKHPKIKLS